jgi:hypothetical protein
VKCGKPAIAHAPPLTDQDDGFENELNFEGGLEQDADLGLLQRFQSKLGHPSKST